MVVSQASTSSSTRRATSVAVIALPHEPRCTGSSIVIAASVPWARTPAAPQATTSPSAKASATTPGALALARSSSRAADRSSPSCAGGEGARARDPRQTRASGWSAVCMGRILGSGRPVPCWGCVRADRTRTNAARRPGDLELAAGRGSPRPHRCAPGAWASEPGARPSGRRAFRGCRPMRYRVAHGSSACLRRDGHLVARRGRARRAPGRRLRELVATAYELHVRRPHGGDRGRGARARPDRRGALRPGARAQALQLAGLGLPRGRRYDDALAAAERTRAGRARARRAPEPGARPCARSRRCTSTPVARRTPWPRSSRPGSAPRAWTTSSWAHPDRAGPRPTRSWASSRRP